MITFRFLTSFLAIIVLAGCVSTTHPLPSASGDPQLHADLETAVAEQLTAGAIVYIVQGDNVVVHDSVGLADRERGLPLTDDTIFRMFSMTKPITSIAIMRLVEQGKVALEDPVSRYLPAFADMSVYVGVGPDGIETVPASRPITIADLLSHSSGLVYPFTGDTPVHRLYRKEGIFRDTPVGRMPGDAAPADNLEQLVERLAHAPLISQPGERFNYSYSTTVLGAIIESVSGVSLAEYLDTEIFKPLDMQDTSFVVGEDDASTRLATLYQRTPDGLQVFETGPLSEYADPDRLLDGGGAVASTTRDYLVFLRMIANGGEVNGVRIVSRQSIEMMFKPRVRIEGLGRSRSMFGYGFALGDKASEELEQIPSGAGSWSGSANTYFLVDPERHAAALLMTQVLTGGDIESMYAIRSILYRAAKRSGAFQ